MPFNQNIPQPGNLLAQSQADLLANNGFLDGSFSVDHTAFSDSTSANGQHKKVTLYQVEALDPILTFPASMLYSKNSGVAPNRTTDLYYATKPEGAAQIIRQLTNLTVTTFVNGGVGAGNGYYVITPWGLFYAWGTTNSAQTDPTVILPAPLAPLSNTTYNVQLTAIGVSTTIQMKSATQTNTGFQVKIATAALMHWSAFGSL